ncbi:MAG: hypothetical protein RSD47_02705 [Romboutsia sp.]
MKNHKLLFGFIFFFMAILQQFEVIYINSKSVFGMTLGSLLVSISTCYSDDFILKTPGSRKQVRIGKLLRRVIYSVGFSIIIIFTYINENDTLSHLMDKLDENTLLLLAMSVTFISMNVGGAKDKDI